MRFLKSKLAVLAILAALQASAQASLLHPWQYTGSGNTWLVLTETRGLSINDILSGVGGWNSQYRFATAAEVQVLLADLHTAPHDYTADNGALGGFFQELGGADAATGMGGTWQAGANAGAIGRTLGALVSVDITDGDAGLALSPDCPAYMVCNRVSVSYLPQDGSDRDSHIGNLLVRIDAHEIPEPSSLALFGLAGLALARWRRRARH
jgi:hypothetical protein